MNVKRFALLGSAALCSSVLFATDYTWSGNATGAWNDAANWTVGGEAATTYPGEAAEDDTVTFPSGDFTVTGVGTGDEATVFKIQKFTCTKGTEEQQNAVTFKNIKLYWTAAPVPASNLRLTFDNVQYGCTASNNSRINFNKMTNIDLVFIGSVTSDGTGKASPLSWIPAGTAFTVTGGGEASLQIYQTPNADCSYLIDGGVFSPKGNTPTSGHYTFKNGGSMELSAVGWTMNETQVNDIVLRTEDLESAGGKARMLGSGNMSMNAGGAMTFNFDLKDAPFGNYVILQHTPSKAPASNSFSVPNPEAENLGYTVNLLNADGKKAHLELEQVYRKTILDSWVRLVVESAGFVDNAWAEPPSVEPDTTWYFDEPPTKVSLGTPLAGEVVASTNGVAVTADEIAAFGLGEHRVDFTVAEKPNEWSGLATNLLIRVIKHENAWVELPSVTAARWFGGSDETNGVARTLGAALFGDVTCNYTDDELRTLAPGRYQVRFEVPETASRDGLSTNFNIFVHGYDTNEVVYTWKDSVTSGTWCDPDNWESDDGLLGYPSNSLVKAVIPTGVRTIDLEGCTIPLKDGSDPGMTVNGKGQTIRNGGLVIGRLWGAGYSSATYEDMVLDLTSQQCSSYYQLQKEATAVLRGNVSVLRGQFIAQAYDTDVTICEGTTLVEGNFSFGNNNDSVQYRATKGTLAISNATLDVGRDIVFGTANQSDHTPPVLRLFDGNIVCTNDYMKSGKYVYGSFRMTSPMTNELFLTEANRQVPRIAANYASLSNLAVVVKSAEGPGRYPLVNATTSLTVNGTNDLTGCSVDVSALGRGWTGSLKLSEDGKKLSLTLGRGFCVIVR